MNRPNPAESRVRNYAAEIMSMDQDIADLEVLKKQGPLMFTEADIYATDWPLDQILRRLFFKHHITEAYFTERYKLYSLRELAKLPTQASNDRSNTVKALKLGNITYKRFIEVIANVLGFRIIKQLYVFEDPSGEQEVLDLSLTK